MTQSAANYFSSFCKKCDVHLNSQFAAILDDINEIAIVSKIQAWCSYNESKGSKKHYKEGRYWTFNTYEQWLKELPWLKLRTLQSKIRKLEKKGILISKQFDMKRGCAVKWYTIDVGVAVRMLNEKLRGISPESDIQPDVNTEKTQEPLGGIVGSAKNALQKASGHLVNFARRASSKSCEISTNTKQYLNKNDAADYGVAFGTPSPPHQQEKETDGRISSAVSCTVKENADAVTGQKEKESLDSALFSPQKNFSEPRERPLDSVPVKEPASKPVEPVRMAADKPPEIRAIDAVEEIKKLRHRQAMMTYKAPRWLEIDEKVQALKSMVFDLINRGLVPAVVARDIGWG